MSQEINPLSRVWWHTQEAGARGPQGQEDLYESEASLEYIASSREGYSETSLGGRCRAAIGWLVLFLTHGT